MPRGYPFPDLELLHKMLAVRGWERMELAERAGISDKLAGRVVSGRPVAVSTLEAVARALLAHQPSSALAEVLGETA